jgi:N-carbamoyl-L-amino-acid hydrolase
LRTLDERRIRTKRPLELVCWTNEEGARFTPPMVASGAFAGVFDVAWVLGLRDDDGKTFGGELERIGYAGKREVGGRGVDAYFELHIEQGPLLEREAVPVGIVVGGYAVRGMHVDVHGETAHAGPTPMDRRRNALVGAAMLAVAVNDVGWRYHATEGKATAPRLVAWPNKAGILAEYAQVTCDVRHADPAVADQMWAEVKAAIPDCAKRANVDMQVAGAWQFGSERFDPACIRLIREAADQLGVRHRDILSQAGHDAYYISRIAPTAMIFTPCRDGISHNEAEHADRDDTVPGVNVLLHAVLARANR